MLEEKKSDYRNIPGSDKRPGLLYDLEDHAQMPAVTVITPFFNADEVFYETARSVFCQSLQQFEWLIINDGSTDSKSIRILDKYRDIDERVHVIDHGKNKGLAAARNTGFRKAKTEYIFQLDSDDLIEPTTLEKCLWFMISHPSCFFTKGYTVGFGQTEFVEWKKSFEDTEEFLRDNPVTATAMIRKSVHRNVGGYDESWKSGLEDWDFWLKCAAHGYWGATIPEHFDWYRTRKDHADRWSGFGKKENDTLRQKLKGRYPILLQKGFPQNDHCCEEASGILNESIPFENRLNKNKRRLLMILPWFAIGGSTKVNLDIVSLLTRKHEYDITICATHTDESPWLASFERYTNDIFILPHFLRNGDFPRFLSYLIQSRDFDCMLITGTPIAYQFLPYLRGRYPKLPIMNLEHIEVESYRHGNYPRFSINLQSCLDLMVVSTAYLKEWMVSRGGDPDRIEVCHTNIDTSILVPSHTRKMVIRKRLAIPSQTPVILFSGRLVDQKRPIVMIEVIRQLEKSAQDFICLVAGDGPLRSLLDQFIKEHGLSRVRLLGWQTPAQINELFQIADIFFLPSENEGISLSIYEAMAMAVPVVCSDVGGQSELVTEECGVLVPKVDNEVDLYVQTLEGLLQNRSLRFALGKAGRNRVCTYFTLEHMGDKMVSLIDKAVALRAERPSSEICPLLGRAYCIEMIEKNRIEAEFNTATEEKGSALNKVRELEKAFERITSGRVYRVVMAIHQVKQRLYNILRLG